MKREALETTYEGEDLPHRLMWAIVAEQAECAKQERDWGKPSLIAMVFAFHAMEAYLNYVGPRLAPELWENERESFRGCGFKGKLREVMERAGLDWQPGKPPIQTVLTLEKLRDAIAHGRPEKRKDTKVHALGTEPPIQAFSLRAMFTPKEKMPRSVAAVERLADEIHKAAKAKLKSRDVWFGEQAFHGPASHSLRSTTLRTAVPSARFSLPHSKQR